MDYVMVSAEHCSSSPWSAANFSTLDYATLERAFHLANQGDINGVFLGPGPRVTRAPGDPCLVSTRVSWLLHTRQFPPGTTEGDKLLALSRNIVNQLTRTLEIAQNVGGQWAPATVTTYDPAVHGPLEFWTSGDATHTRTRNGVDLGAEENRMGPDNAPGFRTRVTASDWIAQHKTALIGVGVVAGVGVLGYAMYRLGLFGGSAPYQEPHDGYPQQYLPQRREDVLLPSGPRREAPRTNLDRPAGPGQSYRGSPVGRRGF